MYEARVDIRKLSQFIQGQFNPTKIICSKLYCTLIITISNGGGGGGGCCYVTIQGMDIPITLISGNIIEQYIISTLSLQSRVFEVGLNITWLLMLYCI